jgi:tRNA threonylcarbamoyladenosine biosynthesis protein TsaE
VSAALVLDSASPDDTRAIGERLGRALRTGDVVLLSGELGAGKTLFVQGLAHGLGFDGPVSSKSFVIMGEYAGREKLYHADLYRLDEAEQVQDLALEEITSDGVLAVEWPERAGDVLPTEHLRLHFEVTGEESRRLHAEPHGERALTLVAALRDCA